VLRKLINRSFLSHTDKHCMSCSLFGFIILHMLMYSANIYFWKRYRVNYTFIFGFKQGTELGDREVFLVSTGLAVLAFVCFLLNLQLDMDWRMKHHKTLPEVIPLCLATVRYSFGVYILCNRYQMESVRLKHLFFFCRLFFSYFFVLSTSYTAQVGFSLYDHCFTVYVPPSTR